MRYRVLPYKKGSKSAKALAEALGGKVLRLEGSTFKCGYEDVVINWGSSDCSEMVDNMTKHLEYPDNTKMFNWMPHLMQRATNKLSFFELMKDTGLTPEFWTSEDEIPDEEYPIVCRTTLSGHSGDGIVIADNREELASAKLFVKYIKKKEEYRVHVGRTGDTVNTISVQRKARRLSTPDEEVDWQVRNLAGGFVYVREGFTLPSACEEAAHSCLRQTGLDFGAVDVIWNETQEKAYVLEINTAPGLEGQTVESYADFFRGVVD
jgi:glutathione synthase/RimK-type ligase-like ATP-grasp enzyme